MEKTQNTKNQSCGWYTVIRVNTISISEMSNKRILIIGFWDGKSWKLLEMLFQRSDALNHRVLWVREQGEAMEPLIYYFKKWWEMEVTGLQFKKYVMEMKTEGFFIIWLLSILNGNWSLQYPKHFNFYMENIISNSQHK